MRKRIRPSTYSTADKHVITVYSSPGDRAEVLFTATYPVDIIRITAKMAMSLAESDAGELGEGTWGLVMAPDGTTLNSMNDHTNNGGTAYEPQSHWLGGCPWHLQYNGTGDGASPHVESEITYEPKEGDTIVGLNVGDRIVFVTNDNGSVGFFQGLVEIELAS